jgi:hypothetical protein
MLGLVALETACFSLLTQHPHRLALVQAVEGWYPPIKFVQLFDRFSKLDTAWQMLFSMWLPSVVWLAASQDKRARPVVLIGVSFIFLLTFLVRGINPIVQWTAFKPRYFAVAAPFFVIAIALLFSHSGRKIWQQYAPRRLLVVGTHFGAWAGPWTLVVCGLLGFASYYLQRESFPQHPLVTVRRDAAIVNDAYRRNLPIVEKHKAHRALNTIAQVYLKDRYLAQADSAKDGRLPNIEEIVRRSKHGGGKSFYILRDASAYRSGDLQELVAKGCAITVRPKTRITLVNAQKLPAHCEAPRGKPLRR